MVLSSAKYKRHNNDAALADDRQNLAEVLPSTSARSPIIISGSNQDRRRRDSLVSFEEDLSTTGSDQLCTANVGDTGGHVRFVDSTIRYHMSPPSFWSRRTILEKVLILLSSSLFFFCFILLVVLSSRQMSSDLDDELSIHVTSSAHPQVCLTPECVKVAATILSDMDMTVDPCKDFYQYSCGGWQLSNPIPDGQSSWSMFEKMWEMNQLVMKNALEEKVLTTSVGNKNNNNNNNNKEESKKPEVLNEAEMKAKLYYESCMDVNGTLEELAGKPMVQLIKQYFNVWPMLEQAKNQSSTMNNLTLAEFQEKLSRLHHDLQSGGFFTWSVGENDKNSTQHVIQIDQGGLTLPTRDFYLRDNDTAVVEALKKVMFKVVKLLRRDSSSSAASNSNSPLMDDEVEAAVRLQIDDLVAFETRIANMTTPLSKRREESQMYTNLTIKDLNEIAAFLNWTTYFGNAFQRINRQISSDEEVVLYASRFMTAISDLVKEHLTTDRGKTTLYNYIVWHAIKPLRLALSKDYRDAGKELEKAMLGKDGHQDRWRFCVSDTDSVLGFAVGAMFVRSTFHGESKPSAQAMIDSIKTAFEERLKDLTWMDNETRNAAIHKARAITDMIGFPEFILDKNQLEEKYKDLRVVANDYFGNNLRSRDYSFLDNMRKLDQPVNRTRWSMTPPTVNAYYTPTKNQIVFPAGILQSPFFNLDYPKSLNYGAMGVVMGHELSHAFDDQGREYDEDGNMRQWWNNATLKTFKNRTACMENQYSSYHFMAQNLSGEQTLGENIADNGGLKASYYAYRQWLRKQPFDEEPPLPGLNMTHNQLFFLSFAQVWCSTSTPQANQLQLLEDSHSPARFRVIGVLSNTKEFSEVFKCPTGSLMNPKDKCEVW